jgi:hypothetical protein
MLGHGRELEILHIEDDLVIAQMYRLGLEYAGYRVTLVADGMAVGLSGVLPVVLAPAPPGGRTDLRTEGV